VWPAQKLLDYGNATLESLRPGMVYVGGTDPGFFIPMLVNETGDDERHIVLTQNGLADPSYLDYINDIYGDRIATLTQDDRQHALQDYIVSRGEQTWTQSVVSKPGQWRCARGVWEGPKGQSWRRPERSGGRRNDWPLGRRASNLRS
jgi:hypothetical protein